MIIVMKKILGIIVIGLLCCSIGYAKTKITEVKRSVNEDGDGLLKLKVNWNNLQIRKLALKFGAGERTRTLDFNLGKVARYTCLMNK